MIDRQSPHLPALDGIRAFAVLAVVSYHAAAVSPGGPEFKGGFLGVSVFFTLSGFLIGSLLVRHHERDGRVGGADFARRRIARLAPAALTTILGVVVVSLTSLAAWGVPQGFSPADAAGAAWNVTNWQLIALDDANLFRLVNPLTHYWSLAVEAQLYLLLVFTCLALTRRLEAGTSLRRRLGIAAAAGWVCSAAIAIVVHGSLRREEFGTDIRLAEFAAGVVLAVLAPRVRAYMEDRRHLADALGLAAIAAFVAAVFTTPRDANWLSSGGYAAVSLVWVAWLVGALHGRVVPELLTWRPLVAVGTISYSLYLVHWPIVLMLKDDRLGVGPWVGWTIRVAVSIVAGALLYVALERRTRRTVAAYPVRTVVGGWVAAMVAVSLVAVVLL